MPRGLINSSNSISPGWVGGRFSGNLLESLLSVVICNFDFICISLRPHKTNAVLLIDSNTILIVLISFQPFESVSRWDLKFGYILYAIDLVKFSSCNRPNLLWTNFSRNFRINSIKNVFRPSVFKVLYHKALYNGMHYRCQPNHD